MASWKKTITTPFRKACKVFNQQSPRDEKKPQTGHENRAMDLHGEVMACAYEDVQVMWSILDKSKSTACGINSS
ncbi:SsrA-binding [Quillaja saponaria]|uniref:SsrA-binding n=1 Tax=Quillaja saponaria TaxID=32244 RepID=A0AAD7QFI9_QUISA|nr:SsrA-binding [Quillaja saponaria]